jgi:hypothetical protein
MTMYMLTVDGIDFRLFESATSAIIYGETYISPLGMSYDWYPV